MIRFFLALICSCALTAMISCNSSTSTSTPVTLTSKSVTFTPDSVKDYYFSFDKDLPSDTSKKTTSEWDLMIKHVFGGGRTFQIDAFVNSGSVNTNGQTRAYVVDTTFDNVSVADISKLRVDSLSNSGRILSPDLTGLGMFNYNPTTHMISPNAQKTLILKTTGGSFYKVQFVNITVSASMYDLSSFTIRYQKGDGTRLK